MANGLVEKQSVQDIANAIRTQNGSATKYKPAEMDEAISSLTNTSDGTAKSTDISKNKTAYVANNKVTGTLEDSNSSYPTVKPATSEYKDSIITLDLDNHTSSKMGIQYVPSANTSADGIILRADTELIVPRTSITNLSAENIKNGVTIAGVTGTLEILDTNDANANANDIANGKTAYVNGAKITGNVETIEQSETNNYPSYSLESYGVNPTTHQISRITKYFSTAPILIRQYAGFYIDLTEENNIAIANSMGLTSNMIKNGETVLGITGTYETDLSELEAIANNILGEGA